MDTALAFASLVRGDVADRLGNTFDPAGKDVTFEKGPSQPAQLQWATYYYDAADQAGYRGSGVVFMFSPMI